MGLMNEYLSRGMSIDDLKNELKCLISEYEKETDHSLLIYAADNSKLDFPISLDMQDLYIISDILPKRRKHADLDFYIETLGGSGEAAEAIAEYLHSKYSTVNFVIAGEAKSAGTILALSGNDIMMTESGSLGPIDAQCQIGRTSVSAYDYMNWVNEKMNREALNPFEITVIAQISPGELYGVQNSLEYAKDLVLKWLPKYKFKNWKITETRGVEVTDDMRKERAKEIADVLTNHEKWRSHGRSLNIKKLNSIRLHVDKIEGRKLEIIDRIQVILRLLFSFTAAYKLFSTIDETIMKTGIRADEPLEPLRIIQFEIKCPHCERVYKYYIDLGADKNKIAEIELQGFNKLRKSKEICCLCGEKIDLTQVIKELEDKLGRKVI